MNILGFLNKKEKLAKEKVQQDFPEEVSENFARINTNYPWVPNDYITQQLTEMRRLWLRSLINPWRELDDWKFLDKVFFVASTARFLNMRTNYVCNTNISFDWERVWKKPGKKNRTACEDLLKPLFFTRKFDFLQYLKYVHRAVATGIEGVYMDWQHKRGLNVPLRSIHVDGRRFRYYQEPVAHTGEHKYVLGILNPMRLTATRVNIPQIYKDAGVYLDEDSNIVDKDGELYKGVLKEQKFGKLLLQEFKEHERQNLQVLIYNNIEPANGTGVGTLVPVYYLVRLQQIIIELLGIAGERFSFPFIGISLDPENFKAGGRSGKKSYTEAVQEVLDIFEKMRAAGVFVAPYALDINMIDVGAGKIESLIKLLQYIDTVIGDAILGSAGAILDNRGTYGAKATQKSLMHTYIEDDYAFLERALNCQLMVQYFELNKHEFRKIGIIDEDDLPWVEIASVRGDDPAEIRENITALAGVGRKPIDTELQKLGLLIEPIGMESEIAQGGGNGEYEEIGTVSEDDISDEQREAVETEAMDDVFVENPEMIQIAGRGAGNRNKKLIMPKGLIGKKGK